MRTTTNRLAMAGILASLAINPVSPDRAWAQEGAVGSLPDGAVARSGPPRSDPQRQEQWRDVAELLTRDAAERAIGSETALDNLRHAAMIRFSIGEPGQALLLMLEAAEEAAMVGRLMTAAHSYLDGAWIAQALGSEEQAIDLARRALLLARSPHLSKVDRDAIRRRVSTSVPDAIVSAGE